MLGSVSGRNIVASLRFGWSAHVELEPGVVFARLHSAFEQESTKRIHVFKSVALVPDYGWAKVRGSIRESLKLRLKEKSS